MFLSLEVYSQTVQGPDNTMAVVGEQVELFCSSSNVQISNMAWQFTPIGGTTPSFIALGCASPPPPYIVSAPNATSCTLIIPSVTLSLAGLYGCYQFVTGGSTEAAQLVVLGMKSNILYKINTLSCRSAFFII